MKAKYVSFIEFDGSRVELKTKKATQPTFNTTDTTLEFEQFLVCKQLSQLTDKESRKHGFYKFKKSCEPLGEYGNSHYNKNGIYTPSGINFLKWLLQTKTEFDATQLEITPSKAIALDSHLGTARYVPLENKYIYDLEWMATVDVQFDYPQGSKPREEIIQIRQDADKFRQKTLTDIYEDQLNWYSKDGTHYIYILELLNIETRETWWYVGQSRDLKNRVKKHIKDPPSPTHTPNKNFFVTGLHSIHGEYDRESEAKRQESEQYKQFILQQETTNVLGGK